MLKNFLNQKHSLILSFLLSFIYFKNNNIIVKKLNVNHVAPTKIVPSDAFSWTADGTTDFSYSPYYFTNYAPGNLGSRLYSRAEANFKIEYYDLNHNFLFYDDAIKLYENFYVVEHSFSFEAPPYYIIIINMNGNGTFIKGNFISIVDGNWHLNK